MVESKRGESPSGVQVGGRASLCEPGLRRRQLRACRGRQCRDHFGWKITIIVGNAKIAGFVFESAVLGLGSPDGATGLEQAADGAVNLVVVLSIPVVPGDHFYLVVSSPARAPGLTWASLLGLTILLFAGLRAAASSGYVTMG